MIRFFKSVAWLIRGLWLAHKASQGGILVRYANRHERRAIKAINRKRRALPPTERERERNERIPGYCGNQLRRA